MGRKRFRRACTSTLLGALGLAAVVVARQEPAPIFRSGVDLIQLDVSVLDRNRHPVSDLTATDFTVRVDGVARPVVAFKAVSLPPPPPPPSAPWMRDVAPDVATNTHPGGRAIVIMIDENTVPPVEGRISPTFWMLKARVTARRVVDELGPDDVAAVVYTVNNHTTQGFTSDRARLLTAIDKSVLLPAPLLLGGTGTPYGKPSSPEQNGYCYCGVCTVEALAYIAESLRSLPQQRKIIIYLSSGVGIRPDITEGCNMLRREAQLNALRKAALANVTINPIDPMGLTPYFDDPDNASSAVSYLRTMAESTGGRAVVNDNDMDLRVPDVLAESSSYYLLGVESTSVVEDGRFHNIDVRVGRPGLDVRTRKGYYDPTKKERKAIAAAAASRDLDGSIEGVRPKSDFPMDVTVAPFSANRFGTGSALAIVLGATQPSAGTVRGTRRAEQVEVVTSLFNPETGDLIRSLRQRLSVAWNPTDSSAGFYEILSRMPAPPGRCEVRVGLKTADGRTASVYAFAEMPNFAGDALSLSGLALAVTPAARVAPPDAFVDLMPIVPTVRRTFRRTDHVSAFLRVYQKKWTGPAAVTMRITSATTAVVASRTASLEGPTGRGSLGADYRVDVPIGGLEPGEYLLSVDVAAGDRKAQRAIRFTMQ